MKRFIGRIWINWVLDDDRSIPKRLANWIARDAKLATYLQNQQALIEQLREAASQWSQASSEVGGNSAANSSTVSPVGSIRAANRQTNRSVESRQWLNLEERFAKWSPASRWLFAVVLVLCVGLASSFLWKIRQTEGRISVADSSDAKAGLSDPSASLQVLEAAGLGWSGLQESQAQIRETFGSVVRAIDNDVLLEQKRLASDLNSMKSYFTELLPSRAAELMGFEIRERPER